MLCSNHAGIWQWHKKIFASKTAPNKPYVCPPPTLLCTRENSLLQHCYAPEKPPSTNIANPPQTHNQIQKIVEKNAMHQRNHPPPTLLCTRETALLKHCKPTTNSQPNPEELWKKRYATHMQLHAVIWQRREKTFAIKYAS